MYLAIGFVAVFSSVASPGNTARADLVLDLGASISGTAPSGSTPWATLDFHTVSTGDVQLTITNHMAASEFLSTVLFNVTGIPSSSLTFAHLSGATTSAIDLNSNGGNNIKAGTFGVDFEYPTAQAGRFAGGMTSVYDITGAGITAQSFDVLSTPDSHALGTYLAAADVQGIPAGGGTTSGSIGTTTAAVPEPSTMTLGAMGLLGMLAYFCRPGHRASA
jgi:PEP-CTERM motif